MALIKCPECSSEVSDKNKSCIKCGYPFSKSKITDKDSDPSPKETKIGRVTACYADNKDVKEIYYNLKSLKEAAWLFLKDHPKEGQHKILVEEKTEFHPLKYTYETSDLRDYVREARPKSDSSWYYNREGEEVEGPILKEELTEKIQNKSIPKGALVWKKGMDDWQEINKVSDFKEYFNENILPPLPYSEINSKTSEQKSRNFKKNYISKDYKSEQKGNWDKNSSIKKEDTYHKTFSSTEKFFSIKGRLSRMGYLKRALPFVFFALIFELLSANSPGSELDIFASIVIFLCSVIVGIQYIKRLHDINYSGWFILVGLIPVVNIIFGFYSLFKKGTIGTNQYGKEPK